MTQCIGLPGYFACLWCCCLREISRGPSPVLRWEANLPCLWQAKHSDVFLFQLFKVKVLCGSPFMHRSKKAAVCFLHLPIGILLMVCLPSSTQRNYVGSHLGWVRNKPGADINLFLISLSINTNRRRFSLSDAGKKVSFELSACLGKNLTVHSKYVLAILLRMHFMCEPYAIFYT